jgi:regulator of sirC expression with transglutaminase-like and TPR domain
MKPEDVRHLFEEAVSRPDDEIDLAEAALLVAQEQYADLDRDHYLGVLDGLAEKAAQRIGDETEPYGIVNRLSEYIFDEEGFRGSDDDYYDPRNSFLNEVLDRRRGIPITLSLVYMEVGKRLRLPIVGVGMPWHFLVKYVAADEEIFIAPYYRGIIMSEQDCSELLERMAGRPIPVQQEYLAAVTKKEIITRILNNLKAIYHHSEDHREALAVVERLIFLNPGEPQEIRDRGLLRYQLDDLTGALSDLERYLAILPNTADTESVVRQLELIRERLQGRENSS